ncbi:hypothetical protein SISSUDRAFT_440020 [Sistotremastrum suecicum HHB10207 ss-3]|uniref:Uncharacterized protein n=1 Tax=Sistotremastrum suecicum HHB10207 ss-3 TaxID=1314776 RepID=A0A166FJW4_9AGAM|nr:hypothetical protein SISSUDRAFT_440020 [Sistotremastrum suecicum HHB10207 ss-3]
MALSFVDGIKSIRDSSCHIAKFGMDVNSSRVALSIHHSTGRSQSPTSYVYVMGILWLSLSLEVLQALPIVFSLPYMWLGDSAPYSSVIIGHLPSSLCRLHWGHLKWFSCVLVRVISTTKSRISVEGSEDAADKSDGHHRKLSSYTRDLLIPHLKEQLYHASKSQISSI